MHQKEVIRLTATPLFGLNNPYLLNGLPTRRLLMNGLSAVDHFLLARNQHNHEQWLEQTVFQTRELREQLADQAGAHQGYRAIVRTLLEAHKNHDWASIEAILDNHNTRTAVYQAAYLPTYNSLKPT
jgi:hypothetical protein